ncbi:hypothetical protein E9Y15_004681 [Escherichia coli]|nr:hypothetical protein [Escherichia coli]
MTDKNCDCNVQLPNTDIFDPIKCVEAWNRCATDQQIHVYLNSEIQKTQQCLQSFVDGQKLVNSTLNTRSLDAIKRITACEQEITRLDGIQTTLQENFRALSSSNNEFKLSTQETLDLYQRSIDALTTANTKLTASQEKLQADLTRLRNELDTDKINQALAGYDAILAEAKKLIAESEHEYSVKIQQLDTSFKSLDAELRNEIATHNSENKKLIDDFRHEVQQQITNINSNLNTYIANTDKTIADFKAAVEKQVNDLSQRIDNSVESINQISGGMSAKLDTLKTEITEQIATEKAQRIDGDEKLKGNFNILSREVKEDIREFKNSVNSNIIDIQDKFNERVNNLEKSLTTKHDADIKTLTDLVEENHEEVTNKINTDVQAVKTELNERITNTETTLNNKIITLESDVNNKFTELNVSNDAKHDELLSKINLVDEASRGRDDSINAEIEKINGKLDGINLDAENLKSEIKGEIKTHVDYLKSEIQATNDKVDNHLVACETIHNELKEQSNKQWTTLNNIEGRYNELVEAINNIREEMKPRPSPEYFREKVTIRNLTEDFVAAGTYLQVAVSDTDQCVVIKPVDCVIMNMNIYNFIYDDAKGYYKIKSKDSYNEQSEYSINFNIITNDDKTIGCTVNASYGKKLANFNLNEYNYYG